MRKTHATVQVAMALLEDHRGKHWGYELSKKSGVRSGTLYPMLTQMLEKGWLSDGWEDPQTITEKRPPRRYYEVTDLGLIRLGALLAEARNDRRFTALPWWRVAGIELGKILLNMLWPRSSGASR
jgi:PadR family transcriptional regulator PadR